MDPVSLLFTAYLDSIQKTVHARFTDLHGTEIKAVMIDYQGVEDPQEFQIWCARDSSLYLPFKHNSPKSLMLCALPKHTHYPAKISLRYTTQWLIEIQYKKSNLCLH